MGCASSVEGTAPPLGESDRSNSPNESPLLNVRASPKRTIGDEVNDESPLQQSKLAPVPGEVMGAVGAAHNIRKLTAFNGQADEPPVRSASPNPLQKPSQSSNEAAVDQGQSPLATRSVRSAEQNHHVGDPSVISQNKLTDSGNNYNSTTENNITRNEVDVEGLDGSSSGEFEMPEEQCAEQVPVAVASPVAADSDSDDGGPVDHGAQEQAPTGGGVGARATPFAMPSAAPAVPSFGSAPRSHEAHGAQSAKMTMDMLSDFEKEFSQPAPKTQAKPNQAAAHSKVENTTSDFDALHRMLDQPPTVAAKPKASPPPPDNYGVSVPLGSMNSDFGSPVAPVREPQPPKEPQPSQLPVRSHSVNTPSPQLASNTSNEAPIPSNTSPSASIANNASPSKTPKKKKKGKKPVVESSSSSSDSESASEPSDNDSDDDAPKKPKGKAAQAAAAIALKRVRAKKKKEKEKKKAAKKAAAAAKGEDSDDD